MGKKRSRISKPTSLSADLRVRCGPERLPFARHADLMPGRGTPEPSSKQRVQAAAVGWLSHCKKSRPGDSSAAAGRRMSPCALFPNSATRLLSSGVLDHALRGTEEAWLPPFAAECFLGAVRARTGGEHTAMQEK